MVIILTAFLAAAQSGPQIDRTALELQARAEALQLRARSQAPGPSKPVAQSDRASVRPGPTRPTVVATAPTAVQRRTQPRRANTGPLDLASVTTICRAAGNQTDPAGFIARLATAYSLSPGDMTSLRASCAAYLAGRADARRASGGTY
jgi:hypothetical protein